MPQRRANIRLLHCAIYAAACIALPTSAADGLQGRQFQIENDRFSRVKPDDRWYTNGFRFSWTYKTPPAFPHTRLLKEGANLLLGGEPDWTPTYTFGQTMYTPQNIASADPPRGDRPWGAFLYGAFSAHRYDSNWFRVVDLKLGATGRAALGGPVQKAVHRVVDATEPLGWHQQLRPRAGVQLSYAAVQRLSTFLDNRVAVQWGAAGALGTIRTYGTVGASVLVGDLRGPVSPVFIGNEGDFVIQDFNNRTQHAKPFAYAALAYTGVGYNYFIEGRTPYGRSEIEPRRGYRTVQWGISVPLRQLREGRSALRLVFAQSTRTAEFNSNAGIREPLQRWGTITLHQDFE
jgi:lipid A 3-O-deacylase